MSNIKRTPSDNPVIDRIEETLKLRKKTKKELLEYLGLNTSTFTMWRYANGKSYTKYIDKISDFLQVSIDYLLYGTEDNSTILKVDADEMIIIKCYRTLDLHKKQLLRDLAETISS